jgi:hypothetical protein
LLVSYSNFTAKEEIDYYCEHCKELKKGIMHSSIHRSPDILILHLKRLIMNSSGGAKIRTLVKFPLNNFDLSQFMTGNLYTTLFSPFFFFFFILSVAPKFLFFDYFCLSLCCSRSLLVLILTSDSVSGSAFFIENMPLKGSAPLKPSLTTHETTGNTTNPDENDGLSSSMMQNLEHSYDLYAVVNHLGGMFGGHYVAYAQCEDLLSPQGGISSSSSLAAEASTISPQIYQKASDLRSLLYDMSEVTLQDYANQNDISTSSPAHLTTALSILQQQQSNNPSIGSAILANNTLETSYRWYKFDDDYAVELTSQHAPIEPTIISGTFAFFSSAFAHALVHLSLFAFLLLSLPSFLSFLSFYPLFPLFFCLENAYLLFYKKKQLSSESLLRYT